MRLYSIKKSGKKQNAVFVIRMVRDQIKSGDLLGYDVSLYNATIGALQKQAGFKITNR